MKNKDNKLFLAYIRAINKEVFFKIVDIVDTNAIIKDKFNDLHYVFLENGAPKLVDFYDEISIYKKDYFDKMINKRVLCTKIKCDIINDLN